MRTYDALLTIVAGTLGFGAVVVAASGAHWAVVMLFAVTAVLFLLRAMWRAVLTPRILVVGDPDGPGGSRRLGALEQALEDAGFAVTCCSGPSHHACPVLEGRPCPLEGRASGVVVHHAATYTGPIPECGHALGLPELCIDEGSAVGAEIGDGEGHIGSGRAVAEAVSAVSTLVRRPVAAR